MNCPLCQSTAYVYSRAEVDGKPVRRRQCKDKENCGVRFGVYVLPSGNEEFIRVYDAPVEIETGVKQRRKNLDYAAAIHEIRKAAHGTMWLPWRTI